MKTPLLSIVVPIYNAEKSIGNLVSRITEQEVSDFELLLIDDGSKDSSSAILKKFEKQDDRVRVFSQKNSGQSVARNLGISKSRGKYLMLFDADDDINLAIIEKMLAKIIDDNVDLVTCEVLYNYIKNSKVISQTHSFTQPVLTQRANESFAQYVVRLLGTDGRLYSLWNKIYRMDLIRKHSLAFETGLNFGEDLMFNLDYLNHVKKMSFLNEPLYIYNFNLAENTSGKSSLVYENRIKNYQEVVKFAGKNPSPELADLLAWIKYYWFYSFALALCASPLSKREKVKRLRDALTIDPLPKPGSRQYIGKSKRRMESIFYSLRNKPGLIYRIIRTLNFFKNNRLFATTWRKFAGKVLR
ncbi:MAG: glycosyltransferase [Candidatus Nomurabacteria bacterium]|jgi:glycosyltransferase involved in cell wall biosynthesis|nr:glycosyltransferase [Candidatus Nomurabacteria bacterium]